MAAPLVLGTGAERTAKAVTQDLVVLAGKVYRQVKAPLVRDGRPGLTKSGRQRFTKVLEPIDVELHVNPVSAGLGVAAAGVAALAGWVAWNGVSIPSPLGGSITLLGGIKDSPLGTWITGEIRRRRLPPAAKSVEELVNTPLSEPLLQTDTVFLQTGRSECEDLLIKYNGASRSNLALASRYRAEAKALGCGWAQ